MSPEVSTCPPFPPVPLSLYTSRTLHSVKFISKNGQTPGRIVVLHRLPGFVHVKPYTRRKNNAISLLKLLSPDKIDQSDSWSHQQFRHKRGLIGRVPEEMQLPLKLTLLLTVYTLSCVRMPVSLSLSLEELRSLKRSPRSYTNRQVIFESKTV